MIRDHEFYWNKLAAYNGKTMPYKVKTENDTDIDEDIIVNLDEWEQVSVPVPSRENYGSTREEELKYHQDRLRSELPPYWIMHKYSHAVFSFYQGKVRKLKPDHKSTSANRLNYDAHFHGERKEYIADYKMIWLMHGTQISDEAFVKIKSCDLRSFVNGLPCHHLDKNLLNYDPYNLMCVTKKQHELLLHNMPANPVEAFKRICELMNGERMSAIFPDEFYDPKTGKRINIPAGEKIYIDTDEEEIIKRANTMMYVNWVLKDMGKIAKELDLSKADMKNLADTFSTLLREE